jgi:hypothetical protein
MSKLSDMEAACQPRDVYLPDPGRAEAQQRPKGPRNFGSMPCDCARVESVSPTASPAGVVPDKDL